MHCLTGSGMLPGTCMCWHKPCTDLFSIVLDQRLSLAMQPMTCKVLSSQLQAEPHISLLK